MSTSAIVQSNLRPDLMLGLPACKPSVRSHGVAEVLPSLASGQGSLWSLSEHLAIRSVTAGADRLAASPTKVGHSYSLMPGTHANGKEIHIYSIRTMALGFRECQTQMRFSCINACVAEEKIRSKCEARLITLDLASAREIMARHGARRRKRGRNGDLARNAYQ